VFLAGFYWKVRRKFSALELYTIFYTMLILSWPQVWSGERYVLPAIYFLAMYFSFAVYRIFKLKFFVIVMSLIIIYNASSIVRFIPLTYERFQALRKGEIARFYPSDWRAFFSCCDWIIQNLPREAVVVSRKPNMLYFRTGNRGFVYPFSPDKESVYRKVREADYILLDRFKWTNSTQRYLYPALLAHRQDFEAVYIYPEDKVYVVRVKK